MTRPKLDARTLRAVARDLAKRAEWSRLQEKQAARELREFAAIMHDARASECEYLADYYRARAREIEKK